MHKELTVAQMLPLITETLSSGGVFTLYPKGGSMLPLLRQGKDAVELISPKEVAVGEIVLFRRENGDFVLHRIIGRRRDGYVLCGDNQFVKESGIRAEQIIARVGAILRDGERIELSDPDYLRYLRTLPARRRKKAVSARFGALRRKLIRKQNT